MKTKVISREKLTVNQVTETIVDRAWKIDNQVKELKKELDELKDKIKEQAVMQDAHEIAGNYATAYLSDTTTYDINIDLLLEWLKKNKKMDLLHAVLKPSVTELTKYLGVISMEEFGIRNTKTFNKLSLKKK
jgi:HPt (histidine-containing phosphotransfer) domain-containing protein